MKRHFLTGLKAFAVSALALAAVSCYDDSELWGELEGLEQRVTDLESKLNSEVSTLNGLLATLDGKVKDLSTEDANILSKLAALNTQVEGAVADAKAAKEAAAAVTDLTSQLDAVDGKVDGVIADLEDAVEALDALDGEVDGKIEKLSGDLKGISTDLAAALAKIAVVKVEEQKDGSVVLTLADGSTLTVGAPATNSDNKGLVTVVDGEWHVVLEDGTTQPLDVPVGVEELEFRVNTQTSELEISVNGADFEGTGVYVKDAETLNVVTGFNESENYVTIFVGDKEYNLPKVSTNVFAIQSGKAYFSAGETQVFKVKSIGMISSFLANSPKGWDVKVSDSEIIVTAPTDDLADYSNEGIIEIWVLMDDGTTLLGKLAVSLTEPPFVLSVDGESLSIDVSGLELEVEDEYGPYTIKYMDVVYGMCLVDNFNPEQLISDIDKSGWAMAPDGAFNNYVGNEWATTVETSFTEMLGVDEVAAGSYVVWAILRGYDDANPLILSSTDFVLHYYNKISVDVEVTPSWNDISFSVDVIGVDKSFAMVMPNNMYEEYCMSYWSDEALMYFPQFGFGDLFFPGMLHYSPYMYFEDHLTSNITTFGMTEESGINEVLPGEDWVIIVLPLTKQNNNDYRLSDVVVKEVSSLELQPLGTSKVTFDTERAELGYNSIRIPYALDGDMLIFDILSDEDMQNYSNDDALYDHLLDDMPFMKSENNSVLVFNNLSLGTEYTVVALAVGSDGKYGKLIKNKLSTKSLPLDTQSSISATISNVVFDPDNANEVTVTYSVSGATKLAVYAKTGDPGCLNSSFYNSISLEDWSLLILTEPENYQIKIFDVVDNQVVVTYNNYGGNINDVYYCAFKTDAQGNVFLMSEPAEYDLSTYSAQ